MPRFLAFSEPGRNTGKGPVVFSKPWLKKSPAEMPACKLPIRELYEGRLRKISSLLQALRESTLAPSKARRQRSSP